MLLREMACPTDSSRGISEIIVYVSDCAVQMRPWIYLLIHPQSHLPVASKYSDVISAFGFMGCFDHTLRALQWPVCRTVEQTALHQTLTVEPDAHYFVHHSNKQS